MKKNIPLSLALLANVAIAECVPARVVVEMPEDVDSVGSYARVHPSGNYILVSLSPVRGKKNQVSIIDMTSVNAQGKIVPKAVETPMNDETYPVEGSWSLLASPNHRSGMHYYKMSDVLDKKMNAVAVLKDSKHNQYYHSSAELPGSSKESIKFRTLLWTGNMIRDYKVDSNEKSKVKPEMSEIKTVCGNIGQLTAPILSKDGTEVASVHSGRTQIFKIKPDYSCELVDDLGYSTGKVNFSYPNPPSRGKVVFQGQKQVMVNGAPESTLGIFTYDRDTKKTTFVSNLSDVAKLPSYPGMTKDGRIIYVNTEEREIIIVDPNQLNSDGSVSTNQDKCIQKTSGVQSKKPVPLSGASKQ